MSVVRCDSCGKWIDSDEEEYYVAGFWELCEACYIDLEEEEDE